ncbi:MAG: sel1 repeat family protein [Muribaculaceae bacterium]|nr:sel1 repeat family protein [Muribaculaceae bacterium]
MTQKAEAGDASAQNSLGCAYHNADGVECDYAKAMEWYLKAAAQGEKYAESNIGILYRYGCGREKDLKTALTWFLKAAEHGLASAQETVGIFYDFGYGTEKNMERAVYWYRKAANNQRGLAQNNLGACFQNGKGVPQDDDQAYYWYSKAARNGNDFGACNLAIMYEEGKGTKQNYALAKRWYEVAIKKKHQRAQTRLNGLLNKYDPNMDKRVFTSSLYANNPFRIMGVYTNATSREIVSNRGRIEAFAKVGKYSSFEVDTIVTGLHKRMYPRQMTLFGIEEPTTRELEFGEKSIGELYRATIACKNLIQRLKEKEIYINALEKEDETLSEEEKQAIEDVTENEYALMDYLHAYDEKRQAMLIPSRSLENMAEASNILSDVRTKLKYAFFWYCKETEEDKRAMDCLIKGDKQQAKDIWQECSNFSSILNLAILAFDEEDDFDFIEHISKIIHEDELRKDFITSICGKDFSISERELSRIFIDVLLDAGPKADWLSAFRARGIDANDDEYIADIMAKEPISIIETELKKISNFTSQDSNVWMNTLQRMQFIVGQQLSIIKDYVGSTNSKYMQVSDKAAEQLIDSSQSYHRACYYTDYDVTSNCVKLAEAALEYACSSIVKDSIEDALADIQRIHRELPPRQVFDTISIIKKKKAEYAEKAETVVNALLFIKECAPLIVKLKDELGKQDKEYLRVSTEVAEFALNITIGQFNKEWQAFSDLVERHKKTSYAYGSVMSIPEVRIALETLRVMLSDCCQLFANLDLFDVLEDWHTRYTRNKTAIVKDAKEASVDIYCKPTIDMRTEQEIFSNATTLTQLQAYLTKYGHKNAKFYLEASQKIKVLEDADNEFWKKVILSNDYLLYLKKYPDGLHSKVAKQIIDRIKAEEDNKFWEVSKPHKAYKAYLSKYPNGIHANEAKDFLQRRDSVVEPIKDIVAAIVFVAAFILTLYFTF